MRRFPYRSVTRYGLATVTLLVAVTAVARAQTPHRPADPRTRPPSPVPGGGMHRAGSGTAWQPDAGPISAIVWGRARPSGEPGPAHPGHEPDARPRRSWEGMLMGYAFPQYVAQGGPRGVSRLVGQNWLMAMVHRSTLRGEQTFRLMLSLEPATVGNNGVPQLLQTGEGLRDHQHPHDLFMEIAAHFARRIDDDLAWTLYLAPVGEPALGPVAYPHRISAQENPQTPLGHHLQDSTHIAYGVITGGIQSHRWRLEGSWFNAQEPDPANRWDFDPIRLNSPSVRIGWNPSARWSLQVSRGWLKAPEVEHPGVDLRRTTASATYVRPSAHGYLAASILWGRNELEDKDEPLDSIGLEATYHWSARHYLWARLEFLDRNELFPAAAGERTFSVGALTLGYSRDVMRAGGWDLAVGGSVTLQLLPSSLRDDYGEFPVGIRVFLRLRPRRLVTH